MITRHTVTLMALAALEAALAASGAAPRQHDAGAATWLAAHAMPLAPDDGGA